MDDNNITLTATLQQDVALAQRVTDCLALVAEVIDGATAEAVWDIQSDEKDRPILSLHVEDQLNGEASTEIAPWELTREDNLRRRLYELNGAVIRIGHWRSQLNQLHELIRNWATTLDGPPVVQDSSVSLNEERSGRYDAPALDINYQGEAVAVVPVAAWVVGAEGRVDIVGPSDRFILVLEDNQWWWVNERQLGTLQQLNEQLFRELLEASVQ